jgi:hypothetical protein
MERVDPEHALQEFDPLLRPSLKHIGNAKPFHQVGIIGIGRARPEQHRFGVVQLAPENVGERQGVTHIESIRVERQAAFAHFDGLVQRRPPRHVTPVVIEVVYVHFGQSGISIGVVRVARDRTLEEQHCLGHLSCGDAADAVPTLKHKIVGVHALGRLALGNLEVFVPDLGDEPRGNCLGDLVLDREYVLERPVVALRPDVGSRGNLDELGRHAHLLARLLHAAFEDIVNSEFMAHPLEVHGRARVSAGRIARRNE